MIPYLAVAIALLIGFCFGCLTMALAQAAKRQPTGSAPGYRRLWVGETPQQHLASSLELLSSLAFARRDLGEETYQVVLAATKRIELAIKQLEKEAA